MNVLKRNPIIESSLTGAAINQMFFSKLQPPDFSTVMKSLMIQSTQEACLSLLDMMKNKDIALAHSGKITYNNEKQPTTNSFECANCMHSKDDIPKNHKLWNCKVIDNYFKCNKKHLAFGPDCKFKDIKKFNYEQYLEKKKNPKDYSSNNKLTGNGKQFANVVSQPTIMPTPSINVDSHIELLKQIAILNKKFDDLTVEPEVFKTHKKITKKSIVIDSGCSDTSINSHKHSDTPIIFNSNNQPLGKITVANGTDVDIQGQGSLLNHTTNLVSEFTNSLLSISQTTQSNNAIAIFTESDCHIVQLDEDILDLLDKILTNSKSKNQILLNGNVVNGLYICEMSDINKTCNSQNCTLRYTQPLAEQQSDLHIKSHKHIHFAGSSYYTNIPSVHVNSIKELVKFFHELWNHASMEMMCAIVDNNLILNLPATLTSKAIRKHFPQCNGCPYGNLQLRPLFSIPFDGFPFVGFPLPPLGSLTPPSFGLSASSLLSPF